MSQSEKLRPLKLSFYAIVSVIIFEFIGGILANSLAVLSDAVHASLDAITTFWLFYTTKLSMKPPDEEHTYGHGKIETLGSMFGGLSLLVVSALLFYESVNRLFGGSIISREFTFIAILSTVYTLCIDVFRMKLLRGISKFSISAKANYLHAIADFSSTIIAFLGVSVASMGLHIGDTLSSLVLCCFIAFLSLRLVYNTSLELSDIAPAKEYKAVKSILKNVDGLKGFKSLRMRKVGAKYFIDVTILLSSKINIEGAHSIASTVEEKIRDLIKDSSITIHYEPLEEELPFSEKIEKIVKKNKGVSGVHQIVSTKTEEGIFLTLHIEVDPTLTLAQAHQITEGIESDIKELFPYIKKTTVHIESSTNAENGKVEYGEKDLNVVMQILNGNAKIKKISSINVYVSRGNRYVDINCSFNGSETVEEIHREISVIESKIKAAIGESIITVHPEPI
ncbi:MAG: cation diffusion facilitator family transporter [Nitrososphaeria archaeon]